MIYIETALREGYEIAPHGHGVGYSLTDDRLRDYFYITIPWWSRKWFDLPFGVYRKGWHKLTLCWMVDDEFGEMELRTWRRR